MMVEDKVVDLQYMVLAAVVALVVLVVLVHQPLLV